MDSNHHCQGQSLASCRLNDMPKVDGPPGFEPGMSEVEAPRNVRSATGRNGQPGETRTRILHLRRVTRVLLRYGLKNGGGCRDRTGQCQLAGLVSHLRDLSPGEHSRSRTAFRCFAGISLAVCVSARKWSGHWESNPAIELGKLALYRLSYARMVLVEGLEPSFLRS